MHRNSKFIKKLNIVIYTNSFQFNFIKFSSKLFTDNKIKQKPNLTDYEKENINLFNDIQDWWNPQGNMRLLHIYNTLRLKYVKSIVEKNNLKLESKKCLDIGCGGGLFTEPLGRLGCNVIGIDPNVNSYNIASNHLQRYMGKEKEFLL